MTDKVTLARGMAPWEVAQKSKSGGVFSLQDQPDLVGKGRLFNGKYYSTESMGNYLAGLNAALSGMFSYDGFQRIAGALHLQKHGCPEINLDTWSMVKLALGIDSYGKHPLHGEVIQQYRMSRQGWNDSINWKRVK